MRHFRGNQGRNEGCTHLVIGRNFHLEVDLDQEGYTEVQSQSTLPTLTTEKVNDIQMIERAGYSEAVVQCMAAVVPELMDYKLSSGKVDYTEARYQNKSLGSLSMNSHTDSNGYNCHSPLAVHESLLTRMPA